MASPTWPSPSPPTPTTPVWTITLRPNVGFHDGTPCDGAAVACTTSRPRSPRCSPARPSPTSPRSPATDPMTVVVTMQHPWVPFAPTWPAASAARSATSPPPACSRTPTGPTSPVGTGPFVFKELEPERPLHRRPRTPTTGAQGYPYLDSHHVPAHPRPRAAAQQPAVGQRRHHAHHHPEIIAAAPGQQLLAYVDDTKHLAGEPDMDCILLNLSKPPFNDPEGPPGGGHGHQLGRVLQGHRQGGRTTPATGPSPATSPYYAPTGYPEPDLAKAKQLVSEVAGSQTGKPVTLSSRPRARPHRPPAIAEFLQSQLQAAGMKVTLNPGPAGRP